jgi:DNA-binding LacI/PurR family transcriptional regulator
VTPSLTTVKMPLSAMGRRGAEMLVRLANGQAVTDRQLVLDAEIVERDSTPALFSAH